MDLEKLYQRWLENTRENEEIYSELCAVQGDGAAIEDRFYQELEFGTGGLRGVIGAGTNRMNVYTVAKATQGVSQYIVEHFADPSVAVAYDSRIHSDLFAQTAAAVFAANGIRVYIYPRLMPTPSLSFAVRDLKCAGGVVVTASHNPAKYNGYKVYGADGCQITTEAAEAIQEAINAVDPFTDVKKGDFGSLLAEGKITYIGEDTVTRYLAAVGTQSVLPEEVSKAVSIVYTPLNGSGISCVPRCLKEHGFTHITIPEEQGTPNGNFPTCPYPNPEIREALEVGLALAERTGSELLLATDPDCDRVGVAVKEKDGYTLINGNQMGVLLLDFICKMRRARGTLPEKPVAVKTIVTTPLAARVAAYYGVELKDVLTGFKYIGEQIAFLEKAGETERYIFGFEESYGYLSGAFVRDKDAVNASLLICEMFAYYKAQGKTLVDVLNELYALHGYFGTRLLSFVFEGSAGFARMETLIDGLRQTPPRDMAGFAMEKMTDYLNDDIPGLPKSNVLKFFLAGGHEVVIRPSGTEPKLKIYLTAVGEDEAASRKVLDGLAECVTGWTKA